jgi:hypothetical protein
LILRTLAATDGQGPSRRVFVLGGRQEHRVNLPAQQSRALNLVWALKERGRLDPSESGTCVRVIVVGAGVAGCTFAAAAAREGAQVLLIDEHEEPVTVQRAATQRFLHPSLFDWPNDGWNRTVADTPVLNWAAAVGANVRNQLVAGLIVALADLDPKPLIWLPQCAALKVDHSPQTEVAVELAAIDDLREDLDLERVPSYRVSADLVVIATGFLPERRIPKAVSGSYWKDDRLAELRKEAMIVGDGDGGLTELFRLGLNGAQNQPLWHQSYLPAIVKDASPGLKAKLRDIEGNVRNDLRGGSLTQLTTDPALQSLDDKVTVRTDRKVTLIGGSPLLRSNSFLINRFLAARIDAQGGDVRLASERVDPVDVPVLAETCDVIWRTGPPPGEQLAEPFFSLAGIVEAIGHSALQSRRAGLAADVLDETRTPWWTQLNPAQFTAVQDVVKQLDHLRVPFPSRAAPPQPQTLDGERKGRVSLRLGDFPVELSSHEVTPSLPDHISRIESTARRLYALAAQMNKPFWWFERTDEAGRISLDLLAIACDIPPFRVAIAIATSSERHVELVPVKPSYADQPRVWVEVDEPAELKSDWPGDVADTAAVINTPPTWKDVDENARVTEEIGPILAPGAGSLAASSELEMSVSELVSSFGEVGALEVGEGLTRSWPASRLLVPLLERLTYKEVTQWRSEPDVEPRLTTVAVDLFTRAIASLDAWLARPALLLFGQFVGMSSENAPVLRWARTTLTPLTPKVTPGVLGRSIMVTSVLDLRALVPPDGDEASSSLHLTLDIATQMFRRARHAKFGDTIVKAGRSEALRRRPTLEIQAAVTGDVYQRVEVDLSYAGVVVSSSVEPPAPAQ